LVIETATFRLVAQSLNRLRYRVFRKLFTLRCKIGYIVFLDLCGLWMLFCVMAIVVGVRSSFLCVILCEYFLFSAVYSTPICGCLIFLCSLLHCVIGGFSSYFARTSSPGPLYSVLCLWGVVLTQCTSRLTYASLNNNYKWTALP
jgi:hypothetical protein